MSPTASQPSLPTPDSGASQPLSPSTQEGYFIGVPTQALYNHVPSTTPHSFPIIEYQPPTALHYPTPPHTAYPSFAALADSHSHGQDGILTPPDASVTLSGFHSSPLPVTGYTGHTFIHSHPHTSSSVYHSPHNPPSHSSSLPNHHPTLVGPPTPGGHFHGRPSQPFNYHPPRTHSLSPKVTDRSISMASAKSAPAEMLELVGDNGGRERRDIHAPSRGLGIGDMETRRTRSAQACDHCRRRKAKCIGNPCQRCTKGNKICTFSPIEHPRGVGRSKVAPTPSVIASASVPQLRRHSLNSQSRRVSSANLAAHRPPVDVSHLGPGQALGLQFQPQYPGSGPSFQPFPAELHPAAQVQAIANQGHPLMLINVDPALDHSSVYYAPVHVGDYMPGPSNMWGLEQGPMGMHLGAVAGEGGWVVQGVGMAEYPQWAAGEKVGDEYLVSRPRTPVSPTGQVDETPKGWPS
ncbi:hypothetical protein IAT38_005692 [Cryptococcus sp. DSM 104549]